MRPDLLWRSSLWLLLASSALAAEPGPPPREFWLYYAEFGGERGELLDPLDYSEASRLPHRVDADESRTATQNAAPTQHEELSDEHAQ